MRLLNTSTGEFQWFNRTDDVRYAILSHVWDKSESGTPLEQSYQDVLALWHAAERLRSEMASDLASGKALPTISILDDPAFSPKIREFCRIARKHGFEFGWADMCCIDKTSSAELSESINSMYDWYSKAGVCYAYLADVPEADDGHSASLSSQSGHPTIAFSSSEWHTRGWTLQELIAPRHVLFLSSSWSVIGSKVSLARALSSMTSVDEGVLRHQVSMHSVSVARRMSWAAKRQTSRVEDEAYSLLGIFGVQIPTIYGEGRNAFKRLEEEIIRTVPDQSIFAWSFLGQPAYSLPNAERRLPDHWRTDWWTEPSALLASSPMYFAHAGDIVPASREEFVRHLPTQWRPDGLPDIHCLFTSEGVRIELLCVELCRTPWGAQEDSHAAPTQAMTIFPAPAGLSVPTQKQWSYTCRDCTEVLAFLRCVHLDGGPVALLLTSPVPIDAGQDPQGVHARRQMRGSHRSNRTFILPSEMKDLLRLTPVSLTRVVMIDISPVIDPATPERSNIRRGPVLYVDLVEPNRPAVVKVKGSPGRYSLLNGDEIQVESWCIDALAAVFTVLSSYYVLDSYSMYGTGGFRTGCFESTLNPKSGPYHCRGVFSITLIVTISRERLLWGDLPSDLEVKLRVKKRSTTSDKEVAPFEGSTICVGDSELLHGVELEFPWEDSSPMSMGRLRLSGQVRSTSGRPLKKRDRNQPGVLWLVLEPLEPWDVPSDTVSA
ncbi:hypothetical protein BV20DRAFT_650506 [Pilatotrama ljubarskyi]|nr:hypothetical protein BV20DRAFT_650506 [Pilatotrama ljubarskyi]